MSMDGNIAWQHTTTQAVNLFDFDDTTGSRR